MGSSMEQLARYVYMRQGVATTPRFCALYTLIRLILYIWGVKGVVHLAEQTLEKGAREDIPGDCVGDGCEDPVQLPHGCLAVSLLAGDAIHQVSGQPLAPEM